MQLAKGRILVVDNDGDMLSLLRRHFESERWVVSTAASGVQAAETIRSDDVEVVLTDLVMDDIDGLGLLREALARPVPPRRAPGRTTTSPSRSSFQRPGSRRPARSTTGASGRKTGV